jgi:hypothetical protein
MAGKAVTRAGWRAGCFGQADLVSFFAASVNTRTKIVLIVSIAILGGALTFWAVRGDKARESDSVWNKSFCVLELQAGTPSISARFSTSRSVDRFQVGMHARGQQRRLSLSVAGRKGSICRFTTLNEDIRFGCGDDIPPGIYEVTLSQEAGNSGGLVTISGESSGSVTLWQVLSRIYLAALLLAGVWMSWVRKSTNFELRAAGVHVFRVLLLGFVTMFLYLLFHEGGHSLAHFAFGRFDFANSDFWGLHGSPHSAGTVGPLLKPWQRSLIAGAGPMLPTFAGWVLFLLWSSRFGQSLRSARPLINIYWSAIVATLVFPGLAATPGYLSGIISDGDWRGFITNVSGPRWLIEGFLWITVPVAAMVLFRVVPEVRRAWKLQKLG